MVKQYGMLFIKRDFYGDGNYVKGRRSVTESSFSRCSGRRGYFFAGENFTSKAPAA